VAVVEALLKAGAVVDLMDKDGETPLDMSKDQQEVKALLRAHGGRTKEEISKQRKNLSKLSIFQSTSHYWTSEVEGARFGMNTGTV
jgi:ankyrin repeat protein